MPWLLLGIVMGALGVLFLLFFAGRPRKYRRIPYQHLPNLIGRLAASLHDRGRIYISHLDADGWIWIQKHVRKVKPSTLTFRYRNTDATKQHFEAVASAFETAGVKVELELTRVRKNPRALRVELAADQAASFAGIARLSRLAFEAIGANRDSRLVVYASDSSPKPPRTR